MTLAAIGLGLVLSLSVWPTASLAGQSAAPGAYCPLPEPGQVPACLDPAKQAYGDFFSALDSEAPNAGALAAVEAAVAEGAEAEEAYLALASLTHGYYRLAQRAAASEDADPEIVERLSRWNDLLSAAYRDNEEDEAYRAAVQRAANDLHQRVPILLPCRDEMGEESACTSTEAVIRGFNATTEEVGIRGGLERLLRRLFGRSTS